VYHDNTLGKKKRRLENSRKAKKAARRLFPTEKWKKIEDGIYLSSARPIGEKSNYQDELRDAQILRNTGDTVYLVSEPNTGGKKNDAIVSGLKMEFKNVIGGKDALRKRFLESRYQAPNVFINLETSNLTRLQIMAALDGARNSAKYPKKGAYNGGKIILKIKGEQEFVYLNVDDLRTPQ